MMMHLNQTLLLMIVLAPLIGSIIAGLFGKQVGKQGAHRAAIAGVGVAFVLSTWVLKLVMDGELYNQSLYQWMQVGSLSFEVGFMIDALTAMMMVV